MLLRTRSLLPGTLVSLNHARLYNLVAHGCSHVAAVSNLVGIGSGAAAATIKTESSAKSDWAAVPSPVLTPAQRPTVPAYSTQLEQV